ncbi:MAG: hypothetical protein KAJ19_17130 [Gammaproteobacteria bacterium]|nr:hypothetical protein [Gammaproteobacteria bacterium]
MGGVTVGPRQFNLGINGVQMGNASTTGPWRVCAIDAAVGHGYYCNTKLDLRALTSDPKKSRGINLTAVSLQEAGPYDMAGGETEQSFIIYDMLTTVELSEEVLFSIWDGLASPGYVPGFLPPAQAVTQTTPGLTPSQVIWGYWRMFGSNRNFTLGTDVATQPTASSYFGDGEIMVGPECYWTRFIATIANATQVVVPSANLTCYAQTVSLTQGQELTQMIRSVGL